MKVILILVGFAALMGGCSYVNSKLGLKDDHPAEEFLEEVIQDQLDLDLDLSPHSPE